jgi:hypothetical protein
MIARIAALLALTSALAGCGAMAAAPTRPGDLSFEYTAIADEGNMDQVLQITNDGDSAVVPTLEITPLDKGGLPIEGLKVTSAFGSERGERVLPALYTDYDVLKFEGERATDVRDVRVTVKRLEQVDYPTVYRDVTVERFDDGRVVRAGDATFDAIELTNTNPNDIPLRIALIGWARAPRGAPQQADWVIPLSDDLVTVPAKKRKLVRMPADLADWVIVSVKPYPAR